MLMACSPNITVKFGESKLEIKTKSIEQTLLPLVKQVLS